MTRIERRFALRRQQGRPVLIMYLCAFDPNAHMTARLMSTLAGAGVDLIELCYPFSDPILDGTVIQRANRRAMQAGGTLEGTFGVLREFRTTDDQTPVVLMGYCHPIVSLGADSFATEAASSGADGLIVADLPPLAAREDLLPALEKNRLSLIPLSAPMLDRDEIVVPKSAQGGFVYCIAAAGPTGGAAPSDDAVATQVRRCRAFVDLPVAVGFGVKTPADAVRVARHADGVVVATALVSKLAELNDAGLSEDEVCAETASFVRSFREALDANDRQSQAG